MLRRLADRQRPGALRDAAAPRSPSDRGGWLACAGGRGSTGRLPGRALRRQRWRQTCVSCSGHAIPSSIPIDFRAHVRVRCDGCSLEPGISGGSSPRSGWPSSRCASRTRAVGRSTKTSSACSVPVVTGTCGSRRMGVSPRSSCCRRRPEPLRGSRHGGPVPCRAPAARSPVARQNLREARRGGRPDRRGGSRRQRGALPERSRRQRNRALRGSAHSRMARGAV